MANGKGCKCGASSAYECDCGVDWTPQEVIDLRAEVERLRVKLAQIRAMCDEVEDIIVLEIDVAKSGRGEGNI